MTTPLWCLFAAVLLPFVWAGFAGKTRKQQFGVLDNHTPRYQQSKVEGRAALAHGAHMNSFEALTYFTPAVLVAHLLHANPGYSAMLAGAFIVVRVLHGMMYLADVPAARTGFFALGLACSVGLFVLAAMAG
jgi:uncharacterized MAPEG superfamily protein